MLWPLVAVTLEFAAIAFVIVVAWKQGYKRGLGKGLDEGYKAGRAREVAWWAEVDHQVDQLKSTHTEEL